MADIYLNVDQAKVVISAYRGGKARGVSAAVAGCWIKLVAGDGVIGSEPTIATLRQLFNDGRLLRGAEQWEPGETLKTAIYRNVGPTLPGERSGVAEVLSLLSLEKHRVVSCDLHPQGGDADGFGVQGYLATNLRYRAFRREASAAVQFERQLGQLRTGRDIGVVEGRFDLRSAANRLMVEAAEAAKREREEAAAKAAAKEAAERAEAERLLKAPSTNLDNQSFAARMRAKRAGRVSDSCL